MGAFKCAENHGFSLFCWRHGGGGDGIGDGVFRKEMVKLGHCNCIDLMQHVNWCCGGPHGAPMLLPKIPSCHCKLIITSDSHIIFYHCDQG